MATQKWIAGSGVGFTWTNAITGTVLNSIASGNAILSDLDITNQTALDILVDVSIALASAAWIGPGPNVGISLYALNKDGSTYGDGRFAASAAGPAPYLVGSIPLVAATQTQVGNCLGIVIPPGTFRFCFTNNGNVAFASSGNTAQYRTYNPSVA